MAVEASSKVGAKMEKVVAECEVALDARVEVVRMRESVLGTLACRAVVVAGRLGLPWLALAGWGGGCREFWRWWML